MKSVVINILKVEIVRVDPRTRLVDIQIDYSANDSRKISMIKTEVKDVEETASKLLKYLRKKEDNSKEGYNVLDGLYVIKITDEELIEEKLGHFFGRVLDKISAVTNKRSADNFLNMYSSLNGQKIEFAKSI